MTTWECSRSCTSASQDGPTDDADGQGCCDLQSRRRNRQRCRARFCVRGSQAVSHRTPPEREEVATRKRSGGMSLEAWRRDLVSDSYFSELRYSITSRIS